MLNYQRVIEETELERTRECRYEFVHDPRITMFEYLMIYDMHMYYILCANGCCQGGSTQPDIYIISLRSH